MKNKSRLTHTDAKGKAQMVDVSAKRNSKRRAVAHARISMTREAFRKIVDNKIQKGDVLLTAHVAGIMAAKKTSELIPLCHPLALSRADLEFRLDERTHSIEILATCGTTGPTGVEMEALTAVAVAALTLYDMCKAVDRTMEISEIYLVLKEGGKSGLFQRKKK
jgi:cyclic pyranopterin phosphate synthase